MANTLTAIEQVATTVATMESTSVLEQLFTPTEGTQLTDNHRRTHERFEISNVFQVIPLGEGGNLLHAESFMAGGKDVSTSDNRLVAPFPDGLPASSTFLCPFDRWPLYGRG